jgi:hypothetical protein
MMFSMLQSSHWGRQNFLAKPLVTHQWMAAALYCIEWRLSYTPFRPNSMNICPQAKRFRKD